jgi:trimeric autotransporter adhesin
VTTSTDNNTGNWLTATPASGTTPGPVQVSVASGSLAPGNYTGTVTITSAGAGGSPLRVGVALTVSMAQTLTVTPATLNFAYTVGTAAPAPVKVALAASGGLAPFSVTTTTTDGGSWLVATPTSGNTPVDLSVSIAPQGLAAGQYTGSVRITSPNAGDAVTTIAVNLAVTMIPKPTVAAVGNAASYVTGAVAPGENIVIFGSGIGPAALTLGKLAANGTVDTTLAGTRVYFDGLPAPILYARTDQTSVMVPYGIGGRPTTNMVVEYMGVQSNAIAYNVVAAAPGIYTLNQSGAGPGAILNQDYGVNGSSAPAARGSVVMVYMTGEGVNSPANTDGAFAPTNGTGLNKPVLPVTATVGGQVAAVKYYGSAPGIIYGVMQVNVEIPAAAVTGPQEVVITVGTAATQSKVTVQVQ